MLVLQHEACQLGDYLFQKQKIEKRKQGWNDCFIRLGAIVEIRKNRKDSKKNWIIELISILKGLPEVVSVLWRP